MDHRHQGGRTVDHGRIDHLTLARTRRLQQRRHHAEGEQHPPAPEIAHQVQRRHRRRIGPAHGPQRTTDGDVVDVMAGPRGQRTVLAPPGHAAVDEGPVPDKTGIGPDAQPLRHAGTESLDESVGPFDQAQHELDRFGVLEVDPHRGTAPGQEVPMARIRGRGTFGSAGGRPLEADDLGAGVSQHHGREGAGPDPRQLDDLDTAERSASR
jgi:hypothetical protein